MDKVSFPGDQHRPRTRFAGIFLILVGYFWQVAGADLQRGVRPVSGRLFPDLFFGYFPEVSPDLFFGYLWAIFGFLRVSGL